MKLQRIENPFWVYECQIPFHIPLHRVFDRVYEVNIPFHIPLHRVFDRVYEVNKPLHIPFLKGI